MRENKRQGGGVALKAVGMSDIGKCRKNNEDAYYISAGEDPRKIYIWLPMGGRLQRGRNREQLCNRRLSGAFLEGNEACRK